MKRKLTFTTFGLVLALTLVAGAFAQEESSKRVAAAPGMAPITVTVIQAGKAIPIESLPPEAQAQLERVKTAAQGLAGNTEPGARKINVTIRCTWEPLSCTITIRF